MNQTFGSDLRKLCESIKGKTEQVVRSGALYMLGGMQERAPVGTTGRLKGNMQVGLDKINRDTSSPGFSDSIARGRVALRAWKPGQTIWLSNSLPYAIVVEYGLYGKPPGSANGPKTVAGFSSQAVGGYVRLSAQQWADYVARAVKDIK